MRERACWICERELSRNDFLKANDKEDAIGLRKMWESPYIELPCCFCWEMIKWLTSGKKDAKAMLKLMDFWKDGRLEKMVKVGIVKESDFNNG